MPILPAIETTPITQAAFGKLAFEVMSHVFAIHDEYGRFFDELVYKRELVEHEFVNIQANLADLRNPEINEVQYRCNSPGASELKEVLLGMLHDWGSGLDLSLYEEGITHFFGGEAKVLVRIPVTGTGGELAMQTMRLLTPYSAFKLTAFPPGSANHANFQTHAQRLLHHTPLHFIQWINIHQNELTLATIE